MKEGTLARIWVLTKQRQTRYLCALQPTTLSSSSSSSSSVGCFFFGGGGGGNWNGSFTGEGLRRSEGVLGCSSFSRFGFGSFFVPISAIANF